jgi:transketolase
MLAEQCEISTIIILASTFGLERYVGTGGRVIGMKTLGVSAPLKELQNQFGFEPELVVAAAKKLLGKT